MRNENNYLNKLFSKIIENVIDFLPYILQKCEGNNLKYCLGLPLGFGVNLRQYFILSWLLMFGAFQTSFTQAIKKDTSSARIEISAFYHQNKVYLRWAPTTADLWFNANIEGYTIEKFEINANDYSQKLISSQKINPWSKNQFRPYLESNNKYLLAAGHAMHGDWESGTNANTNIFGRSEETTNRYSIAMYAADIDSLAARSLGLSFMDDDVSEGKQYFYVVSYQEDSIYIKNGVSIKTEPSALANITIDGVSEEEKRIILYWDHQKYEETYTAFWVEKRSKGGTFKRINEEPVLPVQSTEFAANTISFTDSVSNYVPYEYRLLGITPFGILSSPSPSIIAQGRDKTPPDQPKNLRFTEENQGIKLEWDAVRSNDLSHYNIYRGLVFDGHYEKVNTKPLTKNQLIYYDKSEQIKYNPYFMVSAVDTAGNENKSFKLKTFLRDTTPPEPPVGLSGSIDTNGIVKLHWKANKEEDLDGYMVYFSNQKEYFYTNLTGHVLKDTFFTDTITLKTLSEKIYYRITAVDQFHHISKFSNILELKKPDIIAPTPPQITDIKVEDQKIMIHWNVSKSADVHQQMILKKKNGTKWDTIIPATNQVYIDANIEEGTEYQYTTVSIDDDGLYSITPKPVTVKVPKKIGAFIPKNIEAKYDSLKNAIDVKWQGITDEVSTYSIYRSVNDGPFTNVKTVSSAIPTFLDIYQIKADHHYAYKIRANLLNGVKSPFSETVVVNTKNNAK